MAEPDAIEIKVNIGGDVEHALTALDLNGGKQRRVWFLDDLTEGVRPPLPLLSAGLILRLRRRENGKEESTIKLRPCRRSQLTGSWNIAPEDDRKYRIERDWSRTRHVLAASCDADLVPDTIDRAINGAGQITDVFTESQRDFLAECGEIRVALGGVTALKPIAATQWKNFSIGRVPDVAAERWTVAGLDLLELSIRVTVRSQRSRRATARIGRRGTRPRARIRRQRRFQDHARHEASRRAGLKASHNRNPGRRADIRLPALPARRSAP